MLFTCLTEKQIIIIFFKSLWNQAASQKVGH